MLAAQTMLAEFLRYQLIHQLRISLAFRYLHHLTDKERGYGLLARAVLLHLLGIRGDDLIENLFDC